MKQVARVVTRRTSLLAGLELDSAKNPSFRSFVEIADS